MAENGLSDEKKNKKKKCRQETQRKVWRGLWWILIILMMWMCGARLKTTLIQYFHEIFPVTKSDQKLHLKFK